MKERIKNSEDNKTASFFLLLLNAKRGTLLKTNKSPVFRKDTNMKKAIGLGIVAFLFSFSAVAQEMAFQASGEWDSFYGYAFPDKAYKHRDKRQFFVNTFAVNLGAEKTFTEDYFLGFYADLYAGIDKRQRNYSNGLWGHEIYGIFDNPYGRIMFGETYNVAAQFHISAPKAGKFSTNDSDIVNFIANPNWVKEKHSTAFRTLNSTSINTDGTAAKISYITPEYNNLTLGFSYVPDTYSRTGLVNRDARYADNDGYIAAAYYTADLGFAEMETSLGYAIFNQDDRDFSAGLSFYHAGWTVGGSWRKTYVDGGDYAVTKISNNPKLPDFFDSYRESHAWDAGIGYEFGPFKTAFSYFESKAEHTKNRDKIWLWSNEFQYNKYLKLYLAAAKAEFEGQTKADSNKGYSAITGFSVNF